MDNKPETTREFSKYFPVSEPSQQQPAEGEKDKRIAELENGFSKYIDEKQAEKMADIDEMERQHILIEKLQRRIAELESQLPSGEQTGWVSVSERLPEHGQKVDLWLISENGEKGVRLPWTWERQDTKEIRITGSKVSHWMPQPLPPSSDKGEQQTDNQKM